jgi:membrane protein
VTAWLNDYAPSMGAALSYYSLFSLAPLLLMVITIAGLAFSADVARGAVVAQLDGLIGAEGAVAVEGLLKSASQPGHGLIAATVGIGTLLLGATSVFAELQSDLDRVWRVPAAARPSGIWGLMRTRLLSFGLIVSIGFLLLVSLVISAGLTAFGTWYGALFPGRVIALEIVNQLVSLALVTVLFATMYRVLPSVHVAWRDVWRGGCVTAILFTIGKFLIGLYLGKAGVTSGFGAAGSVVVLLVWVFYSSQIFLLGAEFTWISAESRKAGTKPSSRHQPAGSARSTSDESEPID